MDDNSAWGNLPIQPRITLGAARVAYVGPSLRLSPHQNAAATLALSLGGPFVLKMPSDASPVETEVAVIPPNTHHHLLAEDPMAFVYLDALSDDYQRLRSLDLQAAHARLEQAGWATVAGWDVATLCDAIGIPTRDCREPRIAAAVEKLNARPQDYRRVADLAATTTLSPSRFQALFSKEVGMPFRRYRLWRRMAVVVAALDAGQNLTTAAYAAGFSSSAHLSQSFREMFGIAPSNLVALGVRVDFVGGRPAKEALEGG